MAKDKYFPNKIGILVYNELTHPRNSSTREYIEFLEKEHPLWKKAKKWIAIEWFNVGEGNKGIGKGKRLLKEFEAWAKQKYGDCGLILNPCPIDSTTSFSYLVRWYNHQGFYSADGKTNSTMYKLL